MADLRAVHDRFEHMDQVLSSPVQDDDSVFSKVSHELWLAVKSALETPCPSCARHEAVERELVTALDIAILTIQDMGNYPSGNIPTQEKVSYLKDILSAYKARRSGQSVGRE